MKCYNEECELYRNGDPGINVDNNCRLYRDISVCEEKIIVEDKEIDKIQMTEEQARDFYKKVIIKDSITYLDSFIDNMEEHGYIKKSDLEIAKENWLDVLPKLKIKDILKMQELIIYKEELEKEVEKSLDK